mmetsp:Transcript_7557/g.23014  ORF Transcript_7557/g.23014 Transcript_7557/m.23014 type:complete len:271 (+) Transcript_7557:345-1157(+)
MASLRWIILTWGALVRTARRAASLTTLAMSAPEKLSVFSATARRSTSGASLTLRAWTRRMSTRPRLSGSGTTTVRSSLPGLVSAASRTSGLLVAQTRTTGALVLLGSFESNPSSSQRIWLRVCSRSSEWPRRPRDLATASISSMKTMHGAHLRARSKSSRTRAAPLPTRSSTKAEAEHERKGTFASCAQAIARRVFPVPEGPVRRMPRGHLAPTAAYFSGRHIASTTSKSSRFAASTPATASNPTECEASPLGDLDRVNRRPTEASRGPD